MYSPLKQYWYNNDVNINYERVGNGRQTLIFLHGFGLTLHSWDEIKYKFPLDQYTIYLIDLKGCGFSYNGNGEYSLQEQAKIILSFVSHLKLNSFSLIGHSYGGIVILFALMITSDGLIQNLHKIILIDTPVYPESEPFSVKALKSPVLSFFALFFLTPKWWAKRAINTTFYNRRLAKEKYLNKYIFLYRNIYQKRGVIRTARSVEHSNFKPLRNFLCKIKTPTLILWGEQDNLIPVKYGFMLANEIKASKLEVIKNCGHIPMEELPDIIFDKLIKFIED